MTGTISAALLALPLLAAPDSPAKVGVLCAGPGCGAALQAEVESQLALVPTTELVPGASIAPAVTDAPVQNAAALDAAAQATELLARAEVEYFDADLAAAERTLTTVNELQARGAEATTDRPRYFLISGAVKMKKGNVRGAESDLRNALQLDPDLTSGRFPPSLNEALERVRGTLPPRVLLKLAVTPATAEVHVDGRPMNGVLAVVPGKHQIVARAPGHRTVSRTVTVERRMRMDMALAVSLPAALETAAASWVFAGAADQPPAALSDLATRAGLDRVVVLATRTLPKGGIEARAAIYAPSFSTAKAAPAPVALAADGGAPGVARWVAESVRSATAPVATRKAPRAATASRPLTKRPIFWGGVGALALAVIAGGAVAASSGSDAKTSTDEDRTTLTIGF